MIHPAVTTAPKISPIPSPPKSPLLSKIISLHLTPHLSLQDVLGQIARISGIKLVICTPLPKKGFVYTAQEQPLQNVLKQICELAGLRYHLQENTLHIQENSAYFLTYHVPFLIGQRKSLNRISVASDMITGIHNKEGGRFTGDNGSDTQLTAESQTDFWIDLEKNLSLILKCSEHKDSFFTLNPQASLVCAFGTQKQHQLIESFLSKIQKSATTQVLIEAKIIEVTLSDQFKSGINWNSLGDFFSTALPLGGLTRPGFFKKGTPEKDVFSLAFFKEDMSVIAKFIETFGSVRTLSNPRLTVLNNQSALLKAAKNEIFFRLDVDRTIGSDGKPDVEHTTSRIQTVPIGLVMTVQPCINLETKEIILTLRPTLSRIVTQKSDPAVAIQSDYKIESVIPVVQIREIDSIVTLQSGQVLVMGGLMEERTTFSKSQFPGISDIPFLSYLFQSKDTEKETTELVVFLQATILASES